MPYTSEHAEIPNEQFIDGMESWGIAHHVREKKTADIGVSVGDHHLPGAVTVVHGRGWSFMLFRRSIHTHRIIPVPK